MVWRAYKYILSKFFFKKLVVTITGERNLNFLDIFLETLKSVNRTINTFVIFSNAAGKIVVCPKKENRTVRKNTSN